MDCKECGACCAHAGTGATDFRKAVPTPDTEDTVCTAFSGRIGERCQCLIYANRPDDCREFEMGSVQCLDSRRIAGI